LKEEHGRGLYTNGKEVIERDSLDFNTEGDRRRGN
jgi:hypothetical protein